MTIGTGYIFWIVVLIAAYLVAKLAKASAMAAVKMAIGTVLVCSAALYVLWLFMR